MTDKRRLQNRLNQRAHRARNKKQHVLRGADSGRPYDLMRWRVQLSVGKSLSKTGEDASTLPSETRPPRHQAAPRQPAQCALSVDHIFLPLIRENVFRGLWLNKIMLRALTTAYIPPGTVGGFLSSPTAYPGHAALVPASDNIPADLTPTWSQQNIAHCTMLDQLPCPRMRDNLINARVPVNHQELVRDLLGVVLDLWKPTLPGWLEQEEASGGGGMEGEVVGVMVWGEPHLVSSWEVTPGFVRKWRWLLEGCDDLIRATQRWRTARGEPGISL